MVAEQRRVRSGLGAGLLAATAAVTGGNSIAQEKPPVKEPVPKVVRHKTPDEEIKEIAGKLEVALAHRAFREDSITRLRTQVTRRLEAKDVTEDEKKGMKEFLAQLEDKEKWDAKAKEPKVIDALIRLLGDDEFRVRMAATDALQDISVHADAALRKAFEREKDAEIVRRAQDILQRRRGIDAKTAKTITTLVDRLGGHGQRARIALPLLVEALEKDLPYDDANHLGLKNAALKAVAAFGAEAEAAVPALVSTFENYGGEIHQETLKVLRALGPKAKPAVPTLLHLLQHGNHAMKWDYAPALGDIRTDAADVPDLMKELQSGDAWIRWGAALALVKAGPKAKADNELVRLLRNYLGKDREPDAWVREECVRSLGELRNRAKEAVPDLREALKDEERVQVASARALGKMGEVAKGALDDLKEGKKSPSKVFALACERAVTAIEGKGKGPKR